MFDDDNNNGGGCFTALGTMIILGFVTQYFGVIIAVLGAIFLVLILAIIHVNNKVEDLRDEETRKEQEKKEHEENFY